MNDLDEAIVGEDPYEASERELAYRAERQAEDGLCTFGLGFIDKFCAKVAGHEGEHI